MANLEVSGIQGIVISSVVPPLDSTLREVCERYFGTKPLFIEPGVKTGMPVLYDNPAEVGADRIVNSVAAFEKYGGPCVSVDFGTATTFDWSPPKANTSAASSAQASASPPKRSLDAPPAFPASKFANPPASSALTPSAACSPASTTDISAWSTPSSNACSPRWAKIAKSSPRVASPPSSAPVRATSSRWTTISPWKAYASSGNATLLLVTIKTRIRTVLPRRKLLPKPRPSR